MWRLKIRRHASDIVLGLAAGVILGVVLSFALRLTFFSAPVWLLLAVLAFLGRNNLGVLLAVTAGVLLGCFRTNFALADIRGIRGLVGAEVTLSGVVFEDPDISEDGRFAIKLHNLTANGREFSGNVYAGRLRDADIKRGDRVTLRGNLASGFGSFAGAMYRPAVLAIDRPVPGDLARRARDWFGDLVRRVIPEPEVDLGLGYLLGQRRGLPEAMVEVLRITGLTHIVVASGYNLTVLVRFSRRLFARVSRFAALSAALVLIVCFVMVTGISPSMLRAGLVSVLSLLAWYYGRQFHPYSLLVIVASATLLLSPSYILDLGWLLSFGSFVGVMIYSPLLYAYFFGARRPGFVLQILFETFSAQLLVLPLLIYYFGQVSVVSLPANMLILPTVPLAMLATFLTGVGVLVFPAMAQFFGWAASRVLGYHVAVMNYFGSLDWAVVTVQTGVFGVLTGYAVLVGLGVYLWHATKLDLLGSNIAR
jgi:competence protein ComEC